MSATPARDRFEQFVKEHRGRLTPQRQFIVKEFLALNGHYDIQELYDHFRRQGKDVNPSTIFRTLKAACSGRNCRGTTFRKWKY